MPTTSLQLGETDRRRPSQASGECAVRRCSARSTAWSRPQIELLVELMLSPASQFMTGFWVTGDLSLSDDALSFQPTVDAGRTGSARWEIRFADIADVHWRPGLFSGSIEIEHAGQRTDLRCSASRALAETCKRAVARSRPDNHAS
ncbi:MAG: hypothetical protein ACHP7N_04260 [Caulobacterales bacterium]